MESDMSRRVVAEFFGTFWLVFGGCGSAVVAAGFPDLGIGFLGVSAAFGLTVLTMAYAVGHVSGGHFNPAVTLGLWAAGRCANRHVVPYLIAQVIGAILAAAALWVIASGKPDWIAGAFAAKETLKKADNAPAERCKSLIFLDMESTIRNGSY